MIAAIDPDLFKTCLTHWVERLRLASAETTGPETIAIDGETSRRSHARSKGRGPLHTVSAWATGQQLVLGQEAVCEASNEIIATPLLQRLELKASRMEHRPSRSRHPASRISVHSIPLRDHGG